MSRIALLVPLLLMPSAAQAQVSADTAKLSDLVVTATRVPVAAPRIPAATTILRGDDLRAEGITLVSDALRQVPGMVLVSSGTYGTYASVFLRGGESDYVKVLLDGVPLNEPGGLVNLADLTTTNLDRIEVLRGPASVLYGADAMSGVIQLFTRNGDGGRRGELAVRGGTFGTATAEAMLGGASGAWSGTLSAGRMQSNGIYAFNSGYGNTTGSARLERRDSHGMVAFTARTTEATAHYPTDSYGTPVDHNQYTTDHVMALGLSGRRDFGTGRSLHLSASLSRTRSGSWNRPDGPADTLGFGFDADGDRLTWRRGGEARFDALLGGAMVSVGAGIERESEDQATRTVSNFGFGRDEASQTFAADRTTRDVQAQVIVSPLPPMDIQAGARLDDNSAFGTFGTWRIGLNWRATPRTRAWFAAGTAFKAPTFSELFARSAFEVGNPDLTPERSRSVEFGLEQQLLGARLTARLGVFRQVFRDLVQYSGAAPGETNYHNIGGAKSRGAEFGLTLVVSPRLTLDAHWALVDAVVTDTGLVSSATFALGQPLLRRPRSSGGVTARGRISRATLAVEGEWVGDRADVDFRDFPATRTTLPSYLRVNAGLVLPIGQVGVAGLDLTVRGENLFDASMVEVFGFQGRGRTLLAGGRVRF